MISWLLSQWAMAFIIFFRSISRSHLRIQCGFWKQNQLVPLDPHNKLVTLPSIKSLKVGTWRSVNVTKLNESKACLISLLVISQAFPFTPFSLLWAPCKTIFSFFLLKYFKSRGTEMICEFTNMILMLTLYIKMNMAELFLGSVI
jgi:hypothetical protein